MTGNELMTGDIVDSNSAYIASTLRDAGFSVTNMSTVGDKLAQLVAEITRLSESHDVLLVNGGLGPTEDDLSAQALADAMGVRVREHPDARSHLESFCRIRAIQLSPANLKQALLPESADVLANPVGTAVGFATTFKACRVFCTPGVPSEMKRMLQEQVLPALDQRYPQRQRAIRRRMRVFGYGESSLQQFLQDSFSDWPATIEVGFRASMPMLELKLQAASLSQESLLDEYAQKVRELLGAHLVTEDARALPEVLLDLAREHSVKLTAAESCTGGKISAALTSVSGASDVFEAGFVTYANHIKQQILDVPEQVLSQKGAVSEDVVRAMLTGALKRSGAKIGVAVSGIAGPSGGTAEKPVGTVWLAWGSRKDMRAAAFLIPGSRARFQEWVTAMALDLMRRFIMQDDSAPNYFKERKVS